MDVVNLKDGQEISHPLCFLRIVGIQEGIKSAQIKNLSRPNSDFLQFDCSTHCSAFVLLIEGVNDIIIQCKNDVLKRRVVYRPPSHKKSIRLVYVTCLNEENFQGPLKIRTDSNEAVKRIQIGALLLQTFMAESIALENLDYRTFPLEFCTNNLPKVYVVQLPLTLAQCHMLSNEKLWEYIALHILSSHLGDKNCKYLAFFCGTRYLNPYNVKVSSENEITSMTKGHISLGGGGLALVGTGGLYTWAPDVDSILGHMRNTETVDTSYLMDFSAGRGTWGDTYGTHLGSVLHELAHTLDLGHTLEGIMGRGFEDLHLFFTESSSASVQTQKSTSSQSLEKKDTTFSQRFIPKKTTGKISMYVEPPKVPISHKLLNFKGNLGSRLQTNFCKSNGTPSVFEGNCQSSFEGTNAELNGKLPIHPSLYNPRRDSSESLVSRVTSSNKNTKNTCRAHWSRSNAVLLAYHSWINPRIADSDSSINLKGSVICSSSGIRLIELRDLQMNTFHHWEFTDGSAPSIVHIPWAQVPKWPTDSHIEVVAINDDGAILKGCCIPKPL